MIIARSRIAIARSQNYVKLLVNFQYSKYDLYYKFPIYFAVAFLSYLRWVLTDMFCNRFFSDIYIGNFLYTGIYRKFSIHFTTVFVRCIYGKFSTHISKIFYTFCS